MRIENVDMWITSVDSLFVKCEWGGDNCEHHNCDNWKVKEKYLIQGINEYLKRLTAYAKVEIVELADEKAPENLSETEMEQVKQKRRADSSKAIR